MLSSLYFVIAYEVPLSLFRSSDLIYVKRHLRRTVILEKRAGCVEAILAAFQFRMLHALNYRTDIFPVILCGCEICCLMSQIGGTTSEA